MLLHWLLTDILALAKVVLLTRRPSCALEDEDASGHTSSPDWSEDWGEQRRGIGSSGRGSSSSSSRRERRSSLPPSGTPPRSLTEQPQRARLSPGSHPTLQMVAGIVAVCAQVVASLRWTDAPGRARQLSSFIDMVSPTALVSVLVFLPALAPTFYQRHHRWVLGAVRGCFFALPVIRDPRDMQHVFTSRPSPRFFGLVPDTFSLIVGSRSLALFLAPVICPVPLLPHLLLSAFSLHRCHTTRHMCSQPLLRHPVWARRIAWVHRAAGLLPMVFTEDLGLALSAAEPSSGLDKEMDCRVFLTFVQILAGVLAPTLLIAKMHAPMAAQSSSGTGAGAGAAATASDNGRTHSHHSSGGSGGGGSMLKLAHRKCVAGLRQAAADIEASLQQFCEVLMLQAGSPSISVLAWLFMLSLAWMCALLLEQPGLLLA